MSYTKDEAAEIIKEAFKLACKYMRKYPPAEMPSGEYTDIIWRCIAGGTVEDPDGQRFLSYFIDKAIDNLQ